jgi:adenine/guanine phosphoribosyltransferase-like PRPP-binding protein
MQPQAFWQAFHSAGGVQQSGGYRDSYPAMLADGRQLLLPIRPLDDGQHALASLIINQASFAVLDALAEDLARRLELFRPEVVIGLPTLGLTLAAEVARKLGHARYVPLGTSRKFWYDDALSVPLSSITTPSLEKRLYVDPRMLPLMRGVRAVLVDDVISSGRSILAGLQLLQTLDVEPVALGAAMLQSDRWRKALAGWGGGWPERVCGSLATPLLEKGADGHWYAPFNSETPK